MHQRNIYPLCKRSRNAASNAMSDRQAGGRADRQTKTHARTSRTHTCESKKKRDKHEHTHDTHTPERNDNSNRN